MSQSVEERVSDLELAVSVLCQALLYGAYQAATNAEYAAALEVVESIRKRPIDRTRLEALAQKLGDSVLYVGP